tara:strand:- start:639 stop:914 length:276 start_codon:yes stop_codon:yes gene_type:complete
MIIRAILKIKSDAEVSVTGTDIDTADIVWHDDNPTNITKEQIKSKIQELEYIDKRALEYPSIIDQLDDIYHNGIDGWKTTIKAVKDKYPKE